MQIQKNYDLSRINTFGVPAKAKFYAEISSEEEIPELFAKEDFKNNSRLFLGGASNILFTKDWEGIVILNKLQGIEIVSEDKESVLVRALGGTVWHDLVTFAVERGLWGIENLALIPGSVGAAPMQNIGAYGGELKNTLVSVEAYDVEDGSKRIFEKDECALGYRESVFKNELKGKYFIVAMTLRLQREGEPNINYRVLKEYLENNKIKAKTPQDISDAVSAIRRSKLPDPQILGNAGSFFKNVFVDAQKLAELKERYPDIVSFEEDGVVKIPAGWLIEHAGWKGYREGSVGVHEKQALVLVNYGGATGREVLLLAQKIIASIKEKFGLELRPEVNIV